MGQPIDPTERNFFYNTLSILLRAVEGERTTVDLRNESAINGIVEQADGFMNIVMKDCIFTDPRGDSFKYEIFFVQARNIRYVQIPPHFSHAVHKHAKRLPRCSNAEFATVICS
uniref:Sm domain-containing protein n=1 Tax=Trichogramma kaykai TaxID=54128 RepID=A0ABD2WKQ7_9HYME